jgi:serine/threonine protein kinase
MTEFDDEPQTEMVLRPGAVHAAVNSDSEKFYVGDFDRPDDYEVLHQAHRGAEGVVWRACYRGNLPWPVELAIKQLFAPPGSRPGDELDRRFVDRWNQQLKLLHQIHHDHLVRYQELFKGWPPHPPGTCTGEPPAELATWYFAMEWVDGLSLHDLVRRDEVSLEARILAIVELAEAVEHLHSGAQSSGMPLLHRDIKPGNVIVSPTRGAVLVDYGLLRVEEPGLMTEIQSWTTSYLAPEVHTDKRLTSKSSDIWAVAGTAFFALTGEHPAPSPLNVELMERQLTDALHRKVDDPGDVIRAVMDVIAATPDERPTSPSAWAQRLAEAVGHARNRAVGAVLRDHSPEVPTVALNAVSTLIPAGSDGRDDNRPPPQSRRRRGPGIRATAVMVAALVLLIATVTLWIADANKHTSLNAASHGPSSHTTSTSLTFRPSTSSVGGRSNPVTRSKHGEGRLENSTSAGNHPSNPHNSPHPSGPNSTSKSSGSSQKPSNQNNNSAGSHGGGSPAPSSTTTTSPTTTTSTTGTTTTTSTTQPCSGSTIPTITSVSTMSAAETQTVTIMGSCFGSQASFSKEDNEFLRIADNTSPNVWAGCHYVPGVNTDAVTCSVSEWTNSEIVFTGFSGDWGGDGDDWVLGPGDSVQVSVWNLNDTDVKTTSNAGSYTLTVS